MTDSKKPLAKARAPADAQVADFLAKLARTPAVKPPGSEGRLIFALDATMSRQPTWDQASRVQVEMFDAAAEVGSLRIQLVSFRGFGEFDVRPWTKDAKAMSSAMEAYGCRGGHTQIERVLRHAVEETRKARVQALVFIGDAIEEGPDAVCAAAGELGLLGVPAFVFHEGRDGAAESAFREIARLTKGAYCRFDSGSAQQLRDLLKAVAIFAAGGRKALEAHSRTAGGAALLIAKQIKG